MEKINPSTSGTIPCFSAYFRVGPTVYYHFFPSLFWLILLSGKHTGFQNVKFWPDKYITRGIFLFCQPTGRGFPVQRFLHFPRPKFDWLVE